MNQTEFEIETITPMFMSGEDQGKFELRPSSFKGLMRFWWRAYYWGSNSREMTSEKLEKEEGKIFGTASGKGQRSGVSIRIRNRNLNFSRQKFSGKNGFVLKYLSYGAENREYILPGSSFSVLLNIHDKGVEKDVVLSFYLLSVFGAVGAKARNGFGNFVVRNPELPDGLEFPFPTKSFLDKSIRNDNIPNFSAFSRNMKIFKLKDSCGSWDECLADLGEIYKESKGKLDERLCCDKRQYIASPITVQKRVGGRWRMYDRSFLERRSKPYFMRIVETGSGFDGYMLYLPSKYCEGLDKDRNQNRIDHSEVNENFLESCDEFNEYLGEKMGMFYG